MDDYHDLIFNFFARQGTSTIIALHNNQGCTGQICLHHPYRGANPIVNDVSRPSDAVIFNGEFPTAKGWQKTFSECLSKQKINQFYENDVNDCSMSEASMTWNWKYFSIDTEKNQDGGHLREVDMLEKALTCLRQQGTKVD